MMRRLPPAWVSRFGAVRFPGGRAETAPCDGVCLRDVIRRKADKSPELAVESSKRRPALTATHEAHPSPGEASVESLGPVRLQRFERVRLMSCNRTGPGVRREEDSAGRFHRMRIWPQTAILLQTSFTKIIHISMTYETIIK